MHIPLARFVCLFQESFMRSLSHWLRTSVSVFLLTTSLGASARADLINPGFETGNFTGWTTIGNTVVVGENNQIGSHLTSPIEGRFQARMESGAIDRFDIANFVGIPFFWEPFNQATLTNNGSAIRQTLTANVGDAISFAWTFVTTEQATQIQDFAFFSVTNGSSVADAVILADTQASGSLGKVSGNIIYSFPESGSFTLSFGVMDHADNLRPSYLYVDDVVSARLVAIPVPSAVLLMGIGASCYGLLNRRRHKPTRIG
jgi:hypothetical protein